VGVVNQIALRKGVVPRGNELHGEGRSLYAFLNLASTLRSEFLDRRSVSRARARGKKRKRWNMRLCIPTTCTYETESAEEPVCVPLDADRPLING